MTTKTVQRHPKSSSRHPWIVSAYEDYLQAVLKVRDGTQISTKPQRQRLRWLFRVLKTYVTV